MKYIDIDPIAEVRRNRELLLETHGGMDNLLKRMDKERPTLEKRGWKFVSIDGIIAKKHAAAVQEENS